MQFGFLVLGLVCCVDAVDFRCYRWLVVILRLWVLLYKCFLSWLWVEYCRFYVLVLRVCFLYCFVRVGGVCWCFCFL